MAKAQTDIRTTSYDAATANAFGYQGTIDEVIAQIRSEPDVKPTIKARAELLVFLGVNKATNTGPSVEMDADPRYGFDEPSPGPGKYSLAYAQERGWVPTPPRNLGERLLALSDAQLRLYQHLRVQLGVSDALARAEAFPYPAVRS